MFLLHNEWTWAKQWAWNVKKKIQQRCSSLKRVVYFTSKLVQFQTSADKRHLKRHATIFHLIKQVLFKKYKFRQHVQAAQTENQGANCSRLVNYTACCFHFVCFPINPFSINSIKPSVASGNPRLVIQLSACNPIGYESLHLRLTC